MGQPKTFRDLRYLVTDPPPMMMFMGPEEELVEHLFGAFPCPPGMDIILAAAIDGGLDVGDDYYALGQLHANPSKEQLKVTANDVAIGMDEIENASCSCSIRWELPYFQLGDIVKMDTDDSIGGKLKQEAYVSLGRNYWNSSNYIGNIVELMQPASEVLAEV